MTTAKLALGRRHRRTAICKRQTRYPFRVSAANAAEERDHAAHSPCEVAASRPTNVALSQVDPQRVGLRRDQQRAASRGRRAERINRLPDRRAVRYVDASCRPASPLGRSLSRFESCPNPIRRGELRRRLRDRDDSCLRLAHRDPARVRDRQVGRPGQPRAPARILARHRRTLHLSRSRPDPSGTRSAERATPFYDAR